MSPRKEPSGSFFRCGFSVLELVVVIVILGVLAIFVGGRISGSVAQTRAFYDELLSQVQYARKVAVAQRRPVFVRIEATESRLCYSAAGTCSAVDAVASPRGEAPFRIAIPSGVLVNPVTFQFDALGRPRNAANVPWTMPLTVTVTGDGTYPIVVAHESGYAR